MSEAANVGGSYRLPATLSLLHLRGLLRAVVLVRAIEVLGGVGEGLFVNILGLGGRYGGIV